MDPKEESSSPTIIDHPDSPPADSPAVQRRPGSRSQQPAHTPEYEAPRNPSQRIGKRLSFRAVGMVPIVLGRMRTPKEKVSTSPTYMNSLRAIVTATWLNVLLVFIPISRALYCTMSDNYITVFTTAFIAILPLVKLLAFATEQLALHVNPIISGLVSATSNNVVELIIAIEQLLQREIRVVQSSLVGSILMLGMRFFAGSTRYSEQRFMASAAQLNSSLLTITMIAVLLPAAFYFAVNTTTDPDEGFDILHMSHGVAVVLLLIYACYLFFPLWSHAHLYDEGEHAGETMASVAYPHTGKSLKHAGRSLKGFAMSAIGKKQPTDAESHPEPEHSEADEEVEEPRLNVVSAILLLIVVAVLVWVTAGFLVDSVNGLAAKGVVGEEFVGLILLPLVQNAPEIVMVRVKDKIGLPIDVAVGSSIQIALFIIPLLVIVAWGLDMPLTLLNDPFESAALFLSVLVVNYVVSDGKSNWLEGMILMMLYVIIAVSFWYYPGNNPLEALGAAVNSITCPALSGASG